MLSIGATVIFCVSRAGPDGCFPLLHSLFAGPGHPTDIRQSHRTVARPGDFRMGSTVGFCKGLRRCCMALLRPVRFEANRFRMQRTGKNGVFSYICQRLSENVLDSPLGLS